MTLLFDIAPYAEPVSDTVPGQAIFDRFQAEPDTMVIAVVDARGRPIGLIERNVFLVRMAAQYGHALWSGRPVSFWMKTDPVIVDGDMTVAEFCGRMLKERPSELQEGFIVTCGGRYAGVGTALALLQATAQATATHAGEMSRLAREAQEALAAKGRFLAVMSHEIRTPLNGVLGVAEILRRKSSDPELRPLVDTIRDSGGILLRLLNDALDLSRAEASGLELHEEPLEVASLLEDVIGLWSAQAELRGLRLVAAYDGPVDLWALADRDRLRQVLNNLVGNALKFTAAGRIEVRLSARLDAGCVRLIGEVADQGSGVPAERREDIFSPFQQTEEGARMGGAGLGLAVCRQILQRMNGSIAVRDNPGGGALFAFEAPLHHVPAPASEQAAEVVDSAARALHVLIVDDNTTNRVVAAAICEMFGCTSEAVEDGASGVTAALSGRFDVVLMDIKMPGMDGVEATRLIRSGARSGSQVPILALTANADPADAAFYRASGMNGVVEKPIKPERLLAAMSAVLEIEPEDQPLAVAGGR